MYLNIFNFILIEIPFHGDYFDEIVCKISRFQNLTFSPSRTRESKVTYANRRKFDNTIERSRTIIIKKKS